MARSWSPPARSSSPRTSPPMPMTCSKYTDAGQAQANVLAVAEEGQQDEITLGAVVADAGYWSEVNVGGETDGCELIIATQKDHKQRADLRNAPAPRGRKPKNMTARERMDRKLRTKRGRERYRRRGAAVEPVFGQMKDRQGARHFSMRGSSAAAASGTCTPPCTI